MKLEVESRKLKAGEDKVSILLWLLFNELLKHTKEKLKKEELQAAGGNDALCEDDVSVLQWHVMKEQLEHTEEKLKKEEQKAAGGGK
eukprot:gene7719-888_t